MNNFFSRFFYVIGFIIFIILFSFYIFSYVEVINHSNTNELAIELASIALSLFIVFIFTLVYRSAIKSFKRKRSQKTQIHRGS